MAITSKDCKEVAEYAVKNWFSYQNVQELEYAARSVQNFNPKVIMEIGIAHGASLATWAQVCEPELVIGLDPLNLPKTPEQKESLEKLIKDYDIQMVATHDRDPKAKSKLEQILGDRKIDFLFIDGGHGYHDADYDYNVYKQYLNMPALIGFHDVYYNDTLASSGSLVSYFWERMVRDSKYNYDIFHNHSSMGIGMIYLNESNKDLLLQPWNH